MFQNFSGSLVDGLSAPAATITATTETVLIPTIFTPIPAMSARAGQVWKLTVGGTCTTGTAGTLIIQPRFGLVIAGTAMGVSPTQNYVPSITLAPFLYECWLIFKSIQVAAGATSTVECVGRFQAGGAIATAASSSVIMHSTTGPVSVDHSVASGLWIGVTFSVAPSVIPRFSNWEPRT